MRAFLKRRWFLLSCVAMLVGCGTADVFRYCPTGEPTSGIKGLGIHQGTVFYQYLLMAETDPGFLPRVLHRGVIIHIPKFGTLPEVTHESLPMPTGPPLTVYVFIVIPIWIPLSAVLGWIVIRELRFREKQAPKAVQP